MFPRSGILGPSCTTWCKLFALSSVALNFGTFGLVACCGKYCISSLHLANLTANVLINSVGMEPCNGQCGQVFYLVLAMMGTLGDLVPIVSSVSLYFVFVLCSQKSQQHISAIVEANILIQAHLLRLSCSAFISPLWSQWTPCAPMGHQIGTGFCLFYKTKLWDL